MKYIVFASAGISLFYVSYLLLLRKKDDFKLLRIYLMGSVVLSLLIPLANFEINTGISLFENEPKQVILNYTGSGNALVNKNITIQTSFWQNVTDWFSQLPNMNWGMLITNTYLIICLFLLLRIFLQIVLLINQYFNSTKIKHNDCILLYNDRFSHTFSFFKWIFIQKNQETDELNQILTHEKIHANQFHSLDLMVMELLTAVMWFNPLIWMMKNSVQLVHEYLADEGALNSGIDPLRYRVLLLNQVTEEKLICLSSSFSSVRSPGKYSLIKKRIIMMTNKKISSGTKSGLLTLIPVSAFLLILTGSVNGSLARDTKDINYNNQATFQNTSEVPANNPKIFGETLTETVKSKRSAKVILSDDPDDSVKTTNLQWEDVKVVGYGNQKKDTISVVSRGKSEENNKPAIRIADRELSKVLWLVDGKKVPDISGINPENIQTIEVVKDENIKKYTSEDYDAVMIVTIKKEGVKNEENNKLSVRRADDKTSNERLNNEDVNRDIEVEDLFGEVKIKGKSSKVLYIVDGKEVTDISEINPNNIRSLEVKNDENKRYDGVIVITMKKERVNNK